MEVVAKKTMKMHKNSKAKSVVDSSSDYVKRPSASTDGCLSLLKSCGDGMQLHIPVRKRTRRVPVTCLDNNPNSNKKPRVSVIHANANKIGRRKEKKEELQPSEAYQYKSDQGFRRNCFDGKDVKICRSTFEGPRKRNKKITHDEDELAACDALRTLAEISSMMPFLDAEHVDNDGESIVGRNLIADRVAHSDKTLSDEKVGGESLKKHMKAEKAETSDCSRKSAENESVADEEVKSASSSGQISAISKRCYSSIRSPDLSSSNDPHTGELEVSVCSTQDYAASKVNLARRKNKRKRDRTLLVKDRKNAPNGCLNGSLSVLQDKFLDVQGKLSHCLSSHEVRRWCMYEWFYSAIDYPWFEKREFEEYLNHVGLGHIPRLTRSELGVIRSSLGRPRRFSEHFLQLEREKLKHYRESVRSHYTNVRAGHGGLPPDLACPLYVGQQVVAIHPKTRECCNGSVLTVDRNNCRVQFHHPDLGVELVADLDCMPLNPLENIPETMRRQKRLFGYPYIQHLKVNGATNSAVDEHMKNFDLNKLFVPSISPSYANDMKVKPACLGLHSKAVANGSFSTQLATQNHSRNMAQMHPQEAYVRPILGLTGDLDRKVLNQHSTGSENSYSSCIPVRDAVDLNGTMHSSNDSSFCCEETESNVTEIVGGSRKKAQKMVDTAIKAMSSIVKEDFEIPKDLITSCVATLLVIQNCTERQCPPGEVAQILDNAATSLHPCCPRNVSIYRDIQMCMGRIKTQILALVPT